MIPISLKLKGIYSYQNKEQLIDFQHLCDAGLFGIFGSVGSGKSTILEAISFALYGETERLNKRENRGYNMMNLKSDNLLVDFIFRNGGDNNEYRFIVKGRRNSKNFDDVKTFTREAFKKTDNEWLAISADSTEEITGLSYINFRRTIIIPQGRFQEFLQLGDTDRTKMMKELFQLERFDLSGKTKFLEEKNNTKLTNIEGQLLQLESVSKEKIKEIEEKMALLKTEIIANQKQLKDVELKEAELKALKVLFEKIQLTESELNELKKQQPEFERLKTQLKEYQYCQVHFKSKIEKLAIDKNKAVTLKNELESAKKQFDELNKQLEKLESEFKELKKRFDAKEDLKKEAEAYEKVLQIKQLKIDVESLQNRIKKGNNTIDDCLNTIKELEEKQKSIKSSIAQLKDNEIDIAELAKIKAWFGELNNLEKGKKELQEQITESGKKKKGTVAEIEQLLKEVGYEVEIDPSRIDAFFKTKRSGFETELDEINEELKHLKVKQELSKYSENLQEGDACPVCGATHHPEKMKMEDFSSSNQKLNEKSTLIKKQIENLSASEKQTGLKTAELQLIESQLLGSIKKQKEVEKNIENHKKNYLFEKKYQESELEQEFEKAQKDKKELESLEKQLNEIETLLNKEQKNKEKYQIAINQLENELSAKKAGYETLLQQVELVNINQILDLEDEKINHRMQTMMNEYNQLITNYEQADKNIKRLKPQMDKLIATIEIKEKDLDILNTEIRGDEETLNGEITASKYNSLEDINEILKKDYDIDQEEQKIQSFENQLFSLSEQLQKLKQESDNKHFDPEGYAIILEQLDQLKDLLNQQNKELGAYEKDKKEQEAKLLEKESLTKEFDNLSIRAENIKTLKNLFKASGFVNYVSSVYLQNLVNAANERFAKLTGQKLRLELTETNDFIIRDYLNEGKTRSVKTLSGGQTFQASLSLALALADNIQSMSKSANNFFFLDEGFGSLDKESLATVFQSLKSLRKEKRVVGVISHVEELQQEIDSYLKIENDPESGSKIIRSWE
jgi:exonuclease SbcC